MTIAILGATGHLGTLVIESLLARGSAAENILALGRDPGLLSAHAERGVRTATADYRDPGSLRAALHDVQGALLVSGDVPGARVTLHRNVIEAAVESGVEHFAYTSIVGAPHTVLALAPDHRATEELIAQSGLFATILRNGWYHENFGVELTLAEQDGLIRNSAGAGRVASVARRDLADAAAAILLSPEHQGVAHELPGTQAWTFEEFADIASTALGRTVRYEEVSVEEESARLIRSGLSGPEADFAALLSQNIRAGALAATSDALPTLLGRELTPLIDSLTARH